MPFISKTTLPEKEPVKGFRVRFVHTDNMTLAYWTIQQGSELPEHTHPHEQVANVVAGEFELTIDGVTHNLGPEEVAVIPANAKHGGRATTDCRIIDVFYPVREDYR